MSESMFTSVSRFKTGYAKDQVDEFFTTTRQAYEGTAVDDVTATDIQNASFDLVRGGYETAAVDGALNRLEAAFVARTRAQFIAVNGNDAWMTALADKARTLYPRLSRPAGSRFSPPDKGKPGYLRADVDDVCDRLVGYFDRGEPLTAAELRSSTFAKARVKDGYAEGPVDAFLGRATEVLLGVE
ncbi:MAG: DivIVA domain-containing protein [Cellulomonadaceae bacterium]|jgi:DivIVA domain-containing protein|nr:DivIVA domain-containing protein [Cellulomonadaceae bacterium]